MNKVAAIFNLLRKGSMVADPAMWKRRHIKTAAVAAALLAISQTLEAFGYGHLFPLAAETAAVIAAAVLVVVDLVLVPVTTEKVGLPPVDGPEKAARAEPPEDLWPGP